MIGRVLSIAILSVCVMTLAAGTGLAQGSPVPMTPTSTQGPPATPRMAQTGPEEVTPLDIEVIISRHRGDKRVSNLVYSMAVNANEFKSTQLRMGADVPIRSARAASGSSDAAGPVTFNYHPTGTSIDCNARSLSAGRFQVVIQVDESSVQVRDADNSVPSVDTLPIVRSFRASNTLILRDGQTRQFTAATDPVSGEVVRIEVKLTVVK